MNAPTSISLYQLTGEYLVAAERLADSDLPEEVIRDTLEGLSGELEVKATNIGFFIRNLEATADAIKEAEQQMASRRKALENKADAIRRYLKENMQRCGITKIESPYFNLAIKKNPPSVVIDDPALLPADFMVTPPPPPPSVDKKAIAAALKEGQVVPGAHLEQGERLEIR